MSRVASVDLDEVAPSRKRDHEAGPTRKAAPLDYEDGDAPPRISDCDFSAPSSKPAPPDCVAARLPFRTARSGHVLAGFGKVFRDQTEFAERHQVRHFAETFTKPPKEAPARLFGGDDDYGAIAAADGEEEARDIAADAFFARSELSARADAFVSHAWADSATLKHLALCFYANFHRAVGASWAAWLACILALLGTRGWDPTAFGGVAWLKLVFALVPPTAFYAAFFFGHVAAELWRPRRWWLDKLCIHQRRHFLKVAGIRALPSYVRRSRQLVVLHSETYFSRLWCCHEVAVFLAAHSADRVVVVPLWLAPWVLTVVGMDVVSSLSANVLIDIFVDNFTERLGLAVGPLLACVLVAILAYGPVALPIVLAFRAREEAQRCALEQLSRFSMSKTECSVPEDRAYVEAHVREAYGGRDPVGAFEAAVREDIRRLCSECCGGYGRTPLVLAAIPFLPLVWSSAADVLGCDGNACREAAAINGFADERVFVLANCLSWLFLMALSVYPAILRMLRGTERIHRPWVRQVASPAAVVFAYGAWGMFSGISGAIVYIGMSGDLFSAAVLLAWLGALLAWTARLFR